MVKKRKVKLLFLAIAAKNLTNEGTKRAANGSEEAPG